MAKGQLLSYLQAKQSVLDLTFPGKRTVTGEMKNRWVEHAGLYYCQLADSKFFPSFLTFLTFLNFFSFFRTLVTLPRARLRSPPKLYYS